MLRNVIDQQFAQRSDMLKAHTALVSLRRSADASGAGDPYVIADIDPLLADTHAFEELRMLSLLPSGWATTLNDDGPQWLRRIIRRVGNWRRRARLGLIPRISRGPARRAGATLASAAGASNDPFTTRARQQRRGDGGASARR